jgi:hypothetical protein
MPGVEVRVRGGAKLMAELGVFGRQLPRVVKQAAKEAATPVARQTKAVVPFGPAKGGHVRSSIRVATSRRGVAIRSGGNRFRYYPWLEFGGRVGRRKSVHRERIRAGRYLYPSLVANRAGIERTMNRLIVRAALGSGLNARRR